MKAISLTFALLCIVIIVQGQANNLIEDFKKRWKNAADYTLEVAESMPEEFYDYKPTDEQLSFHDQLLHMVSNMNWLSSQYLGGQALEEDLKNKKYSKEELLAIIQKGFRLSSQAIASLKTEQLGATVDFFAGPMHIRQILTLMNDHMTHHRGQIIVYARLKGIKPPRYRGW